MKKETINNAQLQLAHEFVQNTGRHIFLTGKAGTGKTTFLLNLKNQISKRMIVVAPTGVAAINAGGVTIHSFFQLTFGPQVPGARNAQDGPKRFRREKIDIIKSLDLLVIDEISMVRADLLDRIDETLRRFRGNSLPFGGVQLLMIGDMQQLAPVVKEDEWTVLCGFYDTAFFFSSKALQKTNYVRIVLQHVYRQADQHFISLLNKIRDNLIDNEVIEQLNKRYKPDFEPGDKNYIVLTTHNAKARQVNASKLSAINLKPYRFEAEIRGIFPNYIFPTEETLVLKKGAQVMFVKNDPNPEKRYFNGKIGTITEIDREKIVVSCPDDDDLINISPLEWENIQYSIEESTKEIKETIAGTFTQVPLKLAWAITIHKSQGLTFDRAIIDSEQAFAHGQVYVALSRCRSLEGLILKTPFSPFSLKHDSTIDDFGKKTAENQPNHQELEASKKKYKAQLLTDLFNFTGLMKKMRYLIKVIRENQNNLQPGIEKTFTLVEEPVNKELVQVSVKFQKQFMQYLLEGNNAELQERIIKAVAYFTDKIQTHLIPVINGFSVETDNREVRKNVLNAYQKTKDEIFFKWSCLNACSKGFVLKDYLSAKAKASIETPTPTSKRKTKKMVVSDDILNPELYNLLKEWRNAKCEEMGLPYYMVLPLKTMRALSNQPPSDLQGLKSVHGFGKKKIEKFGNELLELLTRFGRGENPENLLPEKPAGEAKSPKKNTYDISLEFWMKLKDTALVAGKRGLAQTTIEGHLARFVGNGILPVSDFVNKNHLEQIAPYFEKNPETSLTDAREKLGEQFSYTELRFVREYVQLKIKEKEQKGAESV